MAYIVRDKQQEKVNDNSSLIEPCKKLGVSFCCESGFCRTCKITINKGMENLNERTSNEIDMIDLNNERLACQCIIKRGTIYFNYGDVVKCIV